MAINGINSYGMGYYNYQSSINNIRLAQALSKKHKIHAVCCINKRTGNGIAEVKYELYEGVQLQHVRPDECGKHIEEQQQFRSYEYTLCIKL